MSHTLLGTPFCLCPPGAQSATPAQGAAPMPTCWPHSSSFGTSSPLKLESSYRYFYLPPLFWELSWSLSWPFPSSTIWIRCCSSALMVPSGTFCSSSYHSALWYSEHLSASPIERRNAAISVGISNTVTHLLMPRSTLKMKSFIDSKRPGFQVYASTL